MRLVSRFVGLVRRLLGRDRLDRELDDEVLAYLDLLIEDKVAAGRPAAEARRAALIELGGIEPLKERTRDVRVGLLLETFVRDVGYGLRLLRRSPGFSTVAVLTLAVGIGANTAIFSIVNAVLLRDLPYPEPDRIVSIGTESKDGRQPFAAPVFAEFLETSTAFEEIAAFHDDADAMTDRVEIFPPAKYRPVTPGYFQAVGTRLIAGRDFTWAELEQDRLVSIVDATLAAKAWPGADPIGQRLRIERWSTREGPIHLEPLWTEVIGVAENVRSGSLAAGDRETVYLPYGLYAVAELSVLVRSRLDPAGLVEPMRESLRGVDSDLALFNFRRLDEFVTRAVAPQRFSATLLTGLGATGLLLALVGVYGVVSYWVRQRMREIGIRLALGATRREILRLVLGRALGLVGAGVATGMIGALVLTPLLGSQLYGVGPTDVATFLAVAGLTMLVTLAACYVPAHRATRLDPLVVLREE